MSTMPGLALLIAWNQVATSAVLLGMALVARPFIPVAQLPAMKVCARRWLETASAS